MRLNEQLKDRRSKRIIGILFTVFMLLLVLFTLLSNTLQSLTLPKVRAEQSVMGSVVHTLEGSGNIQPLVEVKLVNPSDWKIKEIFIKEGDRVKRGQKLISYDSQSAERELKDEEAQLKKQKIALQQFHDQFILISMEGDEIKIRNASRTIETQKLDIGVQERKIDEMKVKLANDKELSAPFDGFITKVSALEGLSSSGESDVVIANLSHGYQFTFMADADLLSSLDISLGDKVQVKVQVKSDKKTKTIEGEIIELKDVEPRLGYSSAKESDNTETIEQKLLHVKVTDSALIGGEQAHIKLTKKSKQNGLLISNEAIHQDREGMFIYKIEEQRGALGNDFVVHKVRIHSNEKNDKETMIQSDNVYENDLIILESSEPLQDNNRVRLQ
ncbi:efflux RND transporter periplasmic adaptor subunit [Paenibacillus sp. L3-i20]|uniref:efflux RND transporter periplasmic adaptor subunit n=1 Tax=Paenibacillus sp. L3-i20 TaxID=2905833 RepID=UPI001EE0DF4E|nr:efflux RND transporter periplasmic adaptor subunit [Paenibacillus sp. L3-i20]